MRTRTITENDLRKHLGERVRVRNHIGALAEDESGFYISSAELQRKIIEESKDPMDAIMQMSFLRDTDEGIAYLRNRQTIHIVQKTSSGTRVYTYKIYLRN